MGDIRYQFMAVGADGVAGSFRTIEQSAIRSKAAVEALFASMKSPSGGFGAGSFGGAFHGADVAARRSGDREVITSIRHERDERERALRHVASIKERYFREEQRREEQADRQAAKAAETRARQGSWAARMGRGIARSGFDLAGMGAGAVTGAAVLAARQAYQLEEAATRISINARQAGQDFIDPRVLRREFQDTAQASPGVKAIDVADAVQQFITVTGDLDTARKSQKTFATVASATGSSVGDVAQAAAALAMQMGIKGEGQMKEVMAALVAQGKSGSFELRDAASLFPRLAASAGGFGVEKSAQGVKTLGALTQIARGATGSGEQATTAVENIFSNLKMKSGTLRKAGVDVFNDNGTSRNIVDILTDTVAKVGGKDLSKKQAGLQQIFGNDGGRAINPLTSAYIDTFTAQMKAGAKEQDAIAAATKAVRKKMTDFIDGAGDWKEVQKDAARAQESATAKLTAAWEKLVASAGDKLAPSLAKLADGLADGRLLDAMAATIEGFGLMAEGASKFLDKIGMGKKQSPYEVENAAKKKLDEFDAAQPTGPMTPQKAAERARLQGEYDTAHGAAWGKQKPGGFANFDEWNASLGKEFGSVPLERKKELYNDTITSPIKATAELNSVTGRMMDPVSRKAIQDLADQSSASKATNGAVPMPLLVDTRAANQALADLATAADDAARGFSRSPAGDPLGG